MINPRDDIRVEFEGVDFELPGWPGYRTRPGRSGYDPLDAPYERAHFVGRVVRLLLTQKWDADNRLHLVLLNLFGLFSLIYHIFLLYAYISFGKWLRGLRTMGWQGVLRLVVVFSVIYLIIGFGFREIDAIAKEELHET